MIIIVTSVLPNCNASYFTCYCYLKVGKLITLHALHYSCITFELLSQK